MLDLPVFVISGLSFVCFFSSVFKQLPFQLPEGVENIFGFLFRHIQGLGLLVLLSLVFILFLVLLSLLLVLLIILVPILLFLIFIILLILFLIVAVLMLLLLLDRKSVV